MSNEVQVPNSSQMALPSSVMERLAAQAKEAAAKERPAVGWFSAKSGILAYGGTPVPGNKMEVVILAAAYRNVWYAGAFDDNNPAAPNCFALALDDEGMAPHENTQEPVHINCKDCPKSQWNSDPRPNSRGKACKQGRRLVMIPGSVIDKGPDEILRCEFAKMDLPVTSVKNYSAFVNTLAASAGVPPYAAITEIEVHRDLKTQLKITFRAMRVVPNEEALNAIIKRMETANQIALEPYEETAVLEKDPDPEAPEVAAKAPAKTKKF